LRTGKDLQNTSYCLMIRLDIKPLSVNEAWQGKRFKTQKYKEYQKILLLFLPKKTYIPNGKMTIKYRFGFSNKLSDIDNPVKCFQDILQKKYGFNDNDIYVVIAEKEIVPKGKEYIEFSIWDYLD